MAARWNTRMQVRGPGREQALIDALRAGTGRGGFVSGAELARRLGVSRTALWKWVEGLRAAGYEIEARARRGYRLVSAPDLLLPGEIQCGLAANVIGNRIYHYPAVGSTNDEARSLAERGEPEGTVVVAEGQHDGRGRLGRTWLSPAGTGVYLSVILRPPIAPQQAPRLTLVAGLAVARAVRSTCGLPALIKWPNDILLEGRKVAGILTEMRAEVERLGYVVIGVGTNVNLRAADFPAFLKDAATSLREEAGRPVSRVAYARSLLEEMDTLYGRFLAGGYPELLQEYRKYCTVLGQGVQVITPEGETVEGVAADVGEDGALVLERLDGRRQQFLCGEVSVRRSGSPAPGPEDERGRGLGVQGTKIAGGRSSAPH